MFTYCEPVPCLGLPDKYRKKLGLWIASACARRFGDHGTTQNERHPRAQRGTRVRHCGAWRNHEAVVRISYREGVASDGARHRQRSYYQPDWERTGARARRRPTFRSFWPNVRLGSCAADWSDRAHGLQALCPRACREGLRVGGWPRFQRHVFPVFVRRRHQDDVLAESGPSKFSVLQHRNQRFKGLAAAH